MTPSFSNTPNLPSQIGVSARDVPPPVSGRVFFSLGGGVDGHALSLRSLTAARRLKTSDGSKRDYSAVTPASGSPSRYQARPVETFPSAQPRAHQRRFGGVAYPDHCLPPKKKAPARASLTTGNFETLNSCNQTYAGVLSACAKTISEIEKSHIK